jgi:hypothetical protein
MPKSRMILILGVIIALLPLLGFPRAWESFFQIFAGLSIVGLSIWSTINKKLALKRKAQSRRPRPYTESVNAHPIVNSLDEQEM